MFIVNQIFDYFFENVNETNGLELTPAQGPIEILPHVLILEIFSHLNIAALGSSCCVSKAWKQLANDGVIHGSSLWKIAIYREIAFGNDKWVQCFGPDVVKDEDNKEELSSFPWKNFIEDCKIFNTIFPERTAKDSLMLVRLPKTLNGGLTLKSLGELAKKYFPDNDMGYRYIWDGIVQELGDKSIDKSQWVLVTKDVLPGSRNKSYNDQQKIVADLADLAEKSLTGYEVPETLEFAVCILSQYFALNERVFSDKPSTFTRCKEKTQGYQTIVGGFDPNGLYASSPRYNQNYIGIAALRKF